MMSRSPRTLGDGPETPKQWKSESVTYQPTDLLTYLLAGVGARDVYASKTEIKKL